MTVRVEGLTFILWEIRVVKSLCTVLLPRMRLSTEIRINMHVTGVEPLLENGIAKANMIQLIES